MKTMQFIKLPNNTNNEITLLPINQPIFFKANYSKTLKTINLKQNNILTLTKKKKTSLTSILNG